MALVLRDPPKFEPSVILEATTSTASLLLSAEPINAQEWATVFAPPFNVRRIVRCLPQPIDEAAQTQIDALNNKEKKADDGDDDADENSKNKVIVHQIPIHDIVAESILPHLAGAIDFISSSLKLENNSGSVLVHCAAGASRSVAIVLSYLIGRAEQKMTLAMAYEHVKTRRPVARPNIAFFEQLLLFEKEQLYLDAPSMDTDEYVLQGYINRFKSQLSEERMRALFVAKGKPTNAGLMQGFVFEHLCECAAQKNDG